MSDTTARLALPYVVAAQAQKEVTHNQALDLLDALVQAGVADRDLAAPPASPAEGDVYLVAAGASGAWSGQAGRLAVYYGGWQFMAPRPGWTVWVADEGLRLRHDGAAWVVAEGVAGQAVMAAATAVAARAALGAAASGANADLTGLSGLGPGSAAAPALSFAGDGNSGLYSLGADKLGFATGGTLAMHVDENRHLMLGPGSSDDKAKLKVAPAFAAAVASQNVWGYGLYVTFDHFASNYTIAAGASESAGRAGAYIGNFVTTAAFLGALSRQYGQLIEYGHGAGAGAGTITNAYGLFLSYLAAGGATVGSAWGIYQQGSAAANHFDGPVNTASELRVGGSAVVSAARHQRLRSYTLATLPAATTAGEMIWCSDLGGGAGPLVSTGILWARLRHGGIAVDGGDAAVTLTWLADAPVIRHNGTLTANRAVTLSATNAAAGARFRVVRSGAGAFDLDVGGLRSLSTGQWCEVEYDGAAWQLVGFGSL